MTKTKIYQIAKPDGEPIYPVTAAGAVVVPGGGTLDQTLEQIAQRLPVGDDYAGRYWDEDNATPTAAGVAGSVGMLRELPALLGLGRYLVTDDRKRRKLDPADSTKFDDGTDAALDGTMGQCMWCWNAHYYNTRTIGSRTYEAISFKALPGWESYRVPAGGLSWFNAGVIDRTDLKLCSLISDDERYRGGNGNAIADTYTYLPADAPQKTMLGMAATMLSVHNFGAYARRRGEGWEANWFVARAVVEYLFRIIMGTRNSQADFNPEPDANGLRQGGLGAGVTNMPGWSSYNGVLPVIPVNVGLEKGDGTGVATYDVSKSDGTILYSAPVPIFFGLANPFGHLWTGIRGLLIDVGAYSSDSYVAGSMWAEFDDTTVDGLLKAVELSRTEGYTQEYSRHLLCGLPKKASGSNATYFCDYIWTNILATGNRIRLTNGSALNGEGAGIHASNIYNTTTTSNSNTTAPLCYFEEDPIINE